MSSPIRQARWVWFQIPFTEPPKNEYDDEEEVVVKLRRSRLDVSRVVLYYPGDTANRVCLDLDTGEIVVVQGTIDAVQTIIESEPRTSLP